MSYEIWTTKNGEKIKVSDMTTQHIQNTIRCLEDGKIVFLINLGWLEDNDCQVIDEDDLEKVNWIKRFKEELIKRGESEYKVNE